MLDQSSTKFMNKTSIVILLCLLLSVQLCARQLSWSFWPLGYDSTTYADTLHYGASLSAVASTGGSAPFWLQTNRYGNISSEPFSGNLSLYVHKDAIAVRRWYDYDFGINLTGRIDNTLHPTAYLQQCYAHLRLLCFDLTVGIKPINNETLDTDLSMGGFLFSENAHPMPRISIGIDHYQPFPGLFGYVEWKGGLTHAWAMEKSPVKYWQLHHKFVGIRLGGKLPVNIYYEFHHAAQWGGYSERDGNLGNGFKDFLNVFLARSGGTARIDQLNAIGNHLGTQILGLQISTSLVNINAYWHNYMEDGHVYLMGTNPNNYDGLWGICISQNRWKYISAVQYEFLNSTDQSGPYHDKDGLYLGGNDSYFQNYIYSNGWTYFGRTIGVPFISPDNSRVMVHHIGIKGDICSFRYRLLCSYAQNYGNYNIYEPALNRTLKSTNTALLLEVNKHVQKAWGLNFALALAIDFNTNLALPSADNSTNFGVMFTISKIFNYPL